MASKKSAPKKTAPGSGKEIPEETTPQSPGEEAPASGDCMCKQKKPNGKFFCFRLVQGRWVQSSAVPFPTKELCEEACC